MIRQIELKLFKCFKELRLPLGALTLLSGGNASGKSSLLQALVLLHQTMSQHEWSNRLMLNGDEIQLGTVTDVVDQVNGRSSFLIKVVNENNEIHWSFFGERSEMSMEVKEIVVDDSAATDLLQLRFLTPVSQQEKLAGLTDCIRTLTYITAERLGPREVYQIHDSQVTSSVGPFGQYAVSILYEGRDADVIEELVLEGASPKRERQVEERMRTLFPGFVMELQKVAGANAVTLGIKMSPDTDFHRTINVGFGITQVFPIIVAALSAAKGDLLLIENPEVHLHPAGQTRIGEFLASVANAGVQVIVETHSDHVLNGIRKAVKSGTLQPSDVMLHFFRPRDAQGSQVQSPIIDSLGNIDSWPDGFFDQFEKDLSDIVSWDE